MSVIGKVKTFGIGVACLLIAGGFVTYGGVLAVSADSDPVQPPELPTHLLPTHLTADEGATGTARAGEVEPEGMPEPFEWSVLEGPSPCGLDVIAVGYTNANVTGDPTVAHVEVRLYRDRWPHGVGWELVAGARDSDPWAWGGFSAIAEARFRNADCHWYRAVSEHQVIRNAFPVYSRTRHSGPVWVCFCGWCHIPMAQPPSVLAPCD